MYLVFQRLLVVILIGGLSLSVGGCSAYMAANQPGKKNFNVLKAGTPRPEVIAELGKPLSTEVVHGRKNDIFKFVQGYDPEVRAGRAVVHGAASVMTLGLWEVIGTPVEGHFKGTELSIQVQYDPQDRVAQVVPLKGKEEVDSELAKTMKPKPKPQEDQGF